MEDKKLLGSYRAKGIHAFEDPRMYKKGTFSINRLEHPNLEATLASEMVMKWGMVSGMPDGEDSSGRHKLRLATPDELTTRAVETAELLLKKMNDKNWVLNLPAPENVEDEGE